MAFTDPIVAGNELIRAAIQSANYVPGSEGWSIFKNGSAEFDALSLRGPLNVPAIIVNGVDLATALNARSFGCVAWNSGTPTTATTSQAAIIYTEANLIAGRMYEIAVLNITPDVSNAGGSEYHLRYTQGTGSWPDNNSTLLAMSLRLSAFQLGTVRTLFLAPATDRFRFRCSIVSLDGTSVRNWSGFGAGCQIFVNDIGVAPAPNGSVGTLPPGQTLKEFTIEANASRIYNGNGTWRGDDPVYNDTMIQGDWANGRGNQRSWCTFSAADIAKLDDVAGVPLANIEICEVYFSPLVWKNGSGYVTLGYHNQTSLGPLGNGEPGGGIPNVAQFWFVGTGANWLGVKSVTSFMNSLNSGYLNGLMIGNGGGTNGDYAGIMSGYNQVGKPKIHIRYIK